MKIKTKLYSRFKMTNLGKLSWFLRMQFKCKNSTIKMNQSRYIEKISKFDMADCIPRSTPCEMDITKTGDEVDLIDNKLYREIIGSLMHIIVATRPNICYTVTRLSQNLGKRNSFHLTKAKYVLRYLKGNQSVSNIQEIAETLEIRWILWLPEFQQVKDPGKLSWAHNLLEFG